MNHWHKMEIRPRSFTDYWGDDIGVYLRPPQLRYEVVRAEIQSTLDRVFRYSGGDKYSRDIAHRWREGREVPPDTVFDGDTVLVVFGCDNECPRVAQVVLDEWADSMGRKAPRLTTRNLVGRENKPWPADFRRLFDEPAPIEVRRVKRRRRK